MKKLASLALLFIFGSCLIHAQTAQPTATPPVAPRYERPQKPAKEPETPAEFYEAARWERFENLDYDAAIVLLGKAIALDPANADARFFRAGIYSEQKKCQAAIADYNVVIEQVGDAPNTYQERAECKIALKDLRGALADFDASVNLFAAKGQTQYNSLFKRAKLKYLLKDYDGAIADFNTLLNSQHFAGNGEIIFYRALTFMKKGDEGNAAADFKALGDYYFRVTAESRRLYPEHYEEKKDYPEDENPLATLNKKEGEASESSGYGYGTAGGVAVGGSEKKCKGCVKTEYANFEDKIKPDEWFYSDKKRFETSIVTREAEVFFYFLGGALERTGDTAGAVEAFTNAIIAKGYKQSLLYYRRGKLKLQREEYEPAVKDFSWAISQNRGDADAYLERGIAILMLGHDALAQKDFDKYLAFNRAPTAKDALNKRVVEAKKQREKAKRDKATSLPPKSADKSNQPQQFSEIGKP